MFRYFPLFPYAKSTSKWHDNAPCMDLTCKHFKIQRKTADKEIFEDFQPSDRTVLSKENFEFLLKVVNPFVSQVARGYSHSNTK